MRTIHLAIQLLLFTSFYASAQSDFRNGKIKQKNGQELSGFINYTSDDLFRTSCRFKSSLMGESRDYSYFDISSFEFVDGRKFVAKEYKGKTDFYEILLDGVIDVFYIRSDTGDRYFIQSDENNEMSELIYTESYRKEGTANYLIRSVQHKGLLKYYMQDAPQLTKDIERISQPNHRNMIKIVKKYHETVCDSVDCVVYSEELPFISVSFQPSYSMSQIISTKNLDLNGQMETYGAEMYIWLPRFNERFYLKTGLGYTHLTVTGKSSSLGVEGSKEESEVIRIPFGIVYMPLSHRINPKLGAGIKLYDYVGSSNVMHSSSFLAGLNVKLTNKIYLNLNAEFDTITNRKVNVLKSTKSKWFDSSIGLLVKL